MTTREKFEAWYHNNDFEGGYQDGFRLWQAATAEQDKTIAELNARIAELVEVLEFYANLDWKDNTES